MPDSPAGVASASPRRGHTRNSSATSPIKTSTTLLQMRQQTFQSQLSHTESEPTDLTPAVTPSPLMSHEKPLVKKSKCCGIPSAVWGLLMFVIFVIFFIVGGWLAWKTPVGGALDLSTKALLLETEDRVRELANRDIAQAVDVVLIGRSALVDGSFLENVVRTNSSDVTTALYPTSNMTTPPAREFWMTYELLLRKFTVNATVADEDDYTLTGSYAITGYYMASEHQFIGVFFATTARDGQRQLWYQTSDTRELVSYDILDDDGTLSSVATPVTGVPFDQTSRPWFETQMAQARWTTRYEYLKSQTRRGLTAHHSRRVRLAPLPNGTQPEFDIVIASDFIPEYMQPALERTDIPRKGCAFITSSDYLTVARTFVDGDEESAQEQYALNYFKNEKPKHAEPHRTDDGYWVSEATVTASGGILYKVITVLDAEYSEEELRAMTGIGIGLYLVFALVLAITAFVIYEVPLAKREEWFFGVVHFFAPAQYHVMRERAERRQAEFAWAVKCEERAHHELQICEDMVRTAEQELRDRRVRLLSEHLPRARQEWVERVRTETTFAMINDELPRDDTVLSGPTDTTAADFELAEDEFLNFDTLRQHAVARREMAALDVDAVETMVDEDESIVAMQELLDEARIAMSRAKRHHAKLFARRLQARFRLDNSNHRVHSLPVNCPRILLGTFVLLLLVWFMHLTSETLATYDFVDSAMTQAAERHVDVSNRYVQGARLLMELTLSRHELGDMLLLDEAARPPALPPSGVEGPEFNYFDRFFVGTLNAFRNDSGGLNFDAVYYARGDGRMIGAGKRSDPTAAWDIEVMHRDTNTSAYRRTPAESTTFFRNTTTYTDEGNRCYDPIQRSWYQMAVQHAAQVVAGFFTSTGLSEADLSGPRDPRWIAYLQRHPPSFLTKWTDLYSYISGGLGVTLATPLIDPSNSGIGRNNSVYDTVASKYVMGVFAVDIRLGVFHDVLRQTQLRTSPKKRLFLLQRSGRFLAGDLFNSDGTPFELTPLEIQSVVYGDEVSDPVVSDTVTFLRQAGYLLPSVDADGDDEDDIDMSGFSDSVEVAEVPRAVDRPYTFVALVDDVDRVLRKDPWLAVFAVPKQGGLYQEVDDDITVSFITRLAVAIGCGMGLLYCLKIAWSDDESDMRRKAHNEARLAQKAARRDIEMMREMVSNEIEKSVLLAYDTFVNDNNDGEAAGELDDDADLQLRLERAVSHFYESLNIVTTCRLEILRSWKLLRLYRLRSSMWWTVGINIVSFLHLVLGFAEPAYYEHEDPHIAVIVLTALCVLVEMIDWVTRVLVLVRAKRNLLDSRRIVPVTLFHGLLVTLFTIDVVIMCTGPREHLWLLSIRPLLLVVTNERVRTVVDSFWKTLTGQAMRTVLLLYLVVVGVAAAMGVVLFRRVLDDWSPGSVFSNFVRSMTTSFVFISTGENYTDVVYPAYEVSPWYTVYFVAFTVWGMFVILGMIVDRFQDGFEEAYERRKERIQVNSESRLIGAYAVLAGRKQERMTSSRSLRLQGLTELDASDEPEQLLAEDVFKAFLRRITGTESEHDVQSLYQRFDDIDKEACEPGITKTEFVNGMRFVTERVRKLRKRERLRELSHHPGRKWVHDYLLTGWGGALCVMLLKFVVFGELVCLAYYGSYDNDDLLDQLLFVLLLAQVVEICIKVFGWGWRAYFLHDDVHRPRLDRQLANRVDAGIVMLSFVLTIVTRLSTGRILSYKSNDDSLRFALTLCILRLFTLVVSLRRLVFSLAKIVPQFVSMLFVLIGVFYVYAVFGVYLFGDRYGRVHESRLTDARFESLSGSFISLFQLLVGEGWHEVMYSSILATDWIASWYFISYTIIVTLFFANLFIGLVLNSQKEEFEDATADDNEHKEERLQRTLYAHAVSDAQASVFQRRDTYGQNPTEIEMHDDNDAVVDVANRDSSDDGALSDVAEEESPGS